MPAKTTTLTDLPAHVIVYLVNNFVHDDDSLITVTGTELLGMVCRHLRQEMKPYKCRWVYRVRV
jgi:hypothetical protein